jgi:gas vesicle protein
MMRSFIKGFGVGVVIGATAGMMISPKTRKKVMRSKPVKAIMSIGDAVEDLLP